MDIRSVAKGDRCWAVLELTGYEATWFPREPALFSTGDSMATGEAEEVSSTGAGVQLELLTELNERVAMNQPFLHHGLGFPDSLGNFTCLTSLFTRSTFILHDSLSLSSSSNGSSSSTGHFLPLPFSLCAVVFKFFFVLFNTNVIGDI